MARKDAQDARIESLLGDPESLSFEEAVERFYELIETYFKGSNYGC